MVSKQQQANIGQGGMSITVPLIFSQAGDLQAGDVVTFDVTATAGELWMKSHVISLSPVILSKK